jgi:GH24 family phage-related lysozyme (muramidase)
MVNTDKNKPKTLHGIAAIRAIEKEEGELSPEQRFVALKEGYVDGVYEDHKGIKTKGVGQTGKYMYMTYKEAFNELEKECAEKYIPSYYLLTEELRCVIMSAFYRGDIQQSPKFRRLFNEHRYYDAAQEFLNHKEYLASSTPKQIKQRIKEVSEAILGHLR